MAGERETEIKEAGPRAWTLPWLRAGRGRRRAKAKRENWNRELATWSLLSVAVLVAVVYAAPSVAPSIRAVAGGGERGTFLIKEDRCGRKEPCVWIGDFTPENGGPVLKDRRFSGADEAAIGDSVSARDTGDPRRVFTLGFTWTWLWSSAVFLAGTIYLMVLAATIVVFARNALVGVSTMEVLDAPTPEDESGT